MRKKFHALVVVALLGFLIPCLSQAGEEERNLTFHFEWIELPTATLWKLLKEEPDMVRDSLALHGKVRKLAKAGEAEILELARIVTRPGQRAKVENVREFIYPNDYHPPFLPGKGFINIPYNPTTPTAFDVRNVGISVEVDPVFAADGTTIDLNLAPEMVSFGRWRSEQDHLGIAMGGRRPVFYTMRVSTAVAIPSGGQTLVSASSPQDGEGNIDRSRKVLFFVRGESGTPGVSKDPGENITTVFEWVDVEVKTLSDLLMTRGHEGDSGALKAEVDQLVEKGEARLRELVVLPTRGGQRAKIESISELMYPTEYDASPVWPADSKAAPKTVREAIQRMGETPNASSFESRNVGTTVELDPVLTAWDQAVDLQFHAELVGHHGDVWLTPGRGENPKKTGVLQPLFATMATSSSVSQLTDGTPALAAVLTPQVRDGEALSPDPKWRTLLFVRAYVGDGK